MTWQEKHVEGLPAQVDDILSCEGAFVAGSWARSFILRDLGIVPRDEPNDIDVFHIFHPESADLFTIGATPRFHLESTLGYREQRRSPNATTFLYPGGEPVDQDRFVYPGTDDRVLPVQLINPFENDWMQTYGPPKRVLAQFSFTVEQFALWREDGRTWAIYSDEAVEDHEAGRLRIVHINCPVAVAHRVAKYARKGYTIAPMQLMRLFQEWDQRPEEYRRGILEFLEENPDRTPEDWDQLEALLRID